MNERPVEELSDSEIIAEHARLVERLRALEREGVRRADQLRAMIDACYAGERREPSGWDTHCEWCDDRGTVRKHAGTAERVPCPRCGGRR